MSSVFEFGIIGNRKKIVITYFKKTAYQAMNNFNGTFD